MDAEFIARNLLACLLYSFPCVTIIFRKFHFVKPIFVGYNIGVRHIIFAIVASFTDIFLNSSLTIC